ncbi:hypothetical protein [Hymenobacter sp.]|jgi:hypothetical protein|uniref:hypothetical protein n=1 Tax=Hymenobacter sp. TaxID=1898978 RepID=UPI002ED7DC35
MKLLFAFLLSFSLVSLSACKSDKDAEGPATLIGRWQLTNLECYCGPGPLPNEVVEFATNGTVVFYTDGKEESRGTYTFATGKTTCSGDAIPVLQFKNTPSIFTENVAYTLEASTLVLDQGLCLDAPRKTYQRD